VSSLRANNIESLEIGITNNTTEPVVVAPDLLTGVPVLSKEVVENGLLGFPRSVNITIAVISLLFILGRCFMHARYSALTGKTRIFIKGVFVLSVLGLPLAGAFIKIENYIWDQIVNNCLFEPVIVQPGQTITKFIFIDTKTVLAREVMCQIADMHGGQHSIAVQVSSAK
jgi:hypothetical protein